MYSGFVANATIDSDCNVHWLTVPKDTWNPNWDDNDYMPFDDNDSYF